MKRPENRKKISMSYNDERRKRYSEMKTGTKLSDEAKAKISKANKGNQYFLGKHHSLETRQKISERVAQQRTSSRPEVRKKISESWKNRDNTERIEKIRKARNNQVFPFKDSKPELKLQTYLTNIGVDFKKHVHIPGLIKGYHQFDIVINSIKTIFEVQGCYWHGCEIHYPNPTPKQLEARKRDLEIKTQVDKSDWNLFYVWEHEL